MNETKTKIIITAICTIAVVGLTLCSGFFVPFALAFGLISSVFVGYLFTLCGPWCTLICGVFASISALILGGSADALLLVALSFIPGIVSGIMQRNKMEYYSILRGVFLAFGGVMIAILYLAGAGIDGGISGFFDQTAELMKSTMAEMVKASGIANISIEDINVLVEDSIKMVKRTIPSVIIIFSMVFSYIHIALVEFTARKVSSLKLSKIGLDGHLAPKHLSYSYVVISLITLFGSSKGMFGVVCDNLLWVFDFILAFCGLSFIESKFKEKLKYGFVRGIIYVAVFMFLSGIAMQILSVVGMIDSFINFRRIKRNGE